MTLSSSPRLEEFASSHYWYLINRPINYLQTTLASKCKPSLQVYKELLTKHRQQICNLEQQQDNKVAEALCDHWKVKD